MGICKLLDLKLADSFFTLKIKRYLENITKK